MAITVINNNITATTGATIGGFATLSTPSFSVTSGDLVVVTLMAYDAASSCTFTKSAGTGTLGSFATQVVNNNAPSATEFTTWAFATASGTITILATPDATPSSMALCAVVYGGVGSVAQSSKSSSTTSGEVSLTQTMAGPTSWGVMLAGSEGTKTAQTNSLNAVIQRTINANPAGDTTDICLCHAATTANFSSGASLNMKLFHEVGFSTTATMLELVESTTAFTYIAFGSASLAGIAPTRLGLNIPFVGSRSIAGVAPAGLGLTIPFVGSRSLTGSCGLSVGGLVFAGSGGIGVAGVCPFGVMEIFHSSGSCSVSGEAGLALGGLVFVGSGGIGVAGVCPFGVVEIFHSSGSCSVRGEAGLAVSIGREAAGSLSLAGSCPVVLGISHQGNGSCSLAGSAGLVIGVAAEAAGSIVLGGESPSSYGAVFDYVGSGSISLVGSSGIAVGLPLVATGGITLGGSCSPAVGLPIANGGGCGLTGSAGLVIRLACDAGGKFQTGGSGLSSYRPSFTYLASGAISLRGKAALATPSVELDGELRDDEIFGELVIEDSLTGDIYELV